ncbi:MAG: Asp-tRNA(Asn)/Glu-tRNA(Gln) amidotransferase subunit GatC [Planctomycetes bacterium]|nr:Asp-tRNA(Asn)/Glu-tRNA(Gln) amidotransferase subunit GatC [Planctomycetota bacterium]
MTVPHELSIQETAHVAKLARLEVAPDRLEQYRGELASVLGHVAKLKAVDVEGVEPLTSPVDSVNRLAADEPGPVLSLEELLMNAPAVEGRFLAVPKVLAEESS